MAESRNVTVIPATVKMHTGKPIGSSAKRRVAAYARVSTDSDEQYTSYEAQIDYYTRMISERSDWAFAGVYTDEGISGTNTKKRNGFNTMIRDALSGKIDLIVTKSVSRFARNTVDSLTTVRELKEAGVEVFFEKENIYTLDSKGELLITIMSSLAQEESRSISENVTWGMRKRFSDGKVTMAYKRFLGYEKGPDGLPAIVEEEAKVVRDIYEMYLSGKSTGAIAKILTEKGIPTSTGKKVWRSCTVYSILQNEKYKGAALLQKKFTTDFLTKKQKLNEGEVPQYYVENSHPAIIDPAVWEMVKIEIQRRGQLGKSYSCSGIFSGRIFCGECGALYGPRRWTTRSGQDRLVWRCGKKYGSGISCKSPLIEEDRLKDGFIDAFNAVYDDRGLVLDSCRDLLDQLDDTASLEQEIEECIRECEIIAELSKRLLEENSKVPMDQDEFQKRYDSYVKRYEEESEKLERLKQTREEQREKADKLSGFMFEIHERDGLLEEFDVKLWLATIDSVRVTRDGKLIFIFNNGMEVEK